MKTVNAREAALELLLYADQHPDAPLTGALQDRLLPAEGEERSFALRLARGVLGERILLDALLTPYLKKPLSKMEERVRCILEEGLYQMLCMDSVPVQTACDEAVKLTRKKGRAGLAGLVNAVLRKAAADVTSGAMQKRIDGLPLATRCGLPEWIAAHWQEAYGAEAAKALLLAQTKEAPLTLRLRPGFLTMADPIRMTVEERGGRAEAGRYLDYAFRLFHAGDPARLPGYAEGAFTVQDESTMLVTQAMGLCPADDAVASTAPQETSPVTVVDVCAAPGGKSLHAADSLPGGFVIACDLTAAKTDRIRENAARLGVRSIEIREQDATLPAPDLAGRADILLCDLPCSGLGLLWKKRDIRRRLQPADLDALSALQRQILENVLPILKPGGILLYSTCTINPGENEEMASFLEKELGLIPDSLRPYLPAALWEDQAAHPAFAPHLLPDHMLQLYPPVHGVDGFFIARFRRREA